MEIYLIVGVLGLLVALLITNRFNPALLFVVAVSAYMFAGFIPAEDMLGYFANPTLITLLLLLHVSSAVEKTSFIPQLSRQVFSQKSLRFSILRMAGFSLLLSSYLNNTAVVASLMGVVRNNKHWAPSKLLIPLSYAAIMGGVITLIGTSTNLIVNSFVIKAGLPGIKFFDFAYIGIPLAIVGMFYLIFVLPRLLPDHGTEEKRPQPDYFIEAVVSPSSRLIGRTIAVNGFRQMDHLFLAEIVRGDRMISPVTPDEFIQPDDTLVFTGDIAQIQELRKFDGLELHEQTEDILRTNLQEVVVKHNAPIIGRRVKDAQFRTKFDAVVVAVRRGDAKLSGKIGQIILQPGDSLVLAVGKEYRRHDNLRRNFIQVSDVEAVETLTPRQSWMVVGLFVAGIVLAAMEVLPLFQVMVILLLLFLALGFLQVKNLQNNLNVSLLLLIGSSLGISQVISDYGIAGEVGQGLVGLFGGDSPFGALIGIYVATVLTTELITNNAAAALIFPIALSTAQELGVEPMPFIMAIAFAASASFLTPIGYQTNTMVFAVGEYKFTDYFVAGAGLSLLYGVVVTSLIPYFFPF
jgi:di/tricarboxylate transporter